MQQIISKLQQRILRKFLVASRRRRLEEEDATSMGGWLFADSFLALMIIFLATISFIPAVGGAVTNSGNVGNIGGNNYVRGLNLVYEDFDAKLIQNDLNDYYRKEGLSSSSEILYAKIVGGFNINTENEEDGRYRALLFAAKLKKFEVEQFSNSKIDLGSSSSLKSNQIVLRLTVSG